MIRSKTLWLLILSTFLVAGSHAQDMKWLLGTWTAPLSKAGKFHMARNIVIDSVGGENFSGTSTQEADDDNHTKIVTAISGHFNENQFMMRFGEVLYRKDPPHNVWLNCSTCPLYNKIIIKHDTVFLNSEISGCSKFCDGISVYYKFLPDYDTTTQRQLVDLFADSLYAANFKPYDKVAMQRQKATDDSLKIAAAIALKRQQQVDDSLKIVTKREQQVRDSLQNAAIIANKLHEQQVKDSIKNATALEKQHQQHVKDSLNAAAIATAKREQQVKDSLASAAIIANKQREQHLKDSLATAKAREQQRQQHVNDSLKTVALVVAARQKQTNDSLRNATILAKQRQKQADDSLKAVAALAVKRQKQVDDSLKAVAVLAAKRQKQVDDSLANAAVIAKKRQQQIDDSLKNAAIVAQKQQQHIDDSLNKVAMAAAANSQAVIPASKALEQRQNVLVQSFHITTPDILVELFDNAQIDGDMVSVYHNNELIVDKQKLLRDPITLHIHADSVNREHEFILVADNLGTIPPNTALMRITAGKQRYQLTVKTDLSNNAKIILYYDGNEVKSQ